MNDDHTVALPLVKIATAWGAAFGMKSWGDLASFCAAIYTLLLIGEWIYKKIKALRGIK